MSSKYISTQQAAEFLNVTRQHISALVRQGHIKATRIGRVLLINYNSVVKYYHPKGRPFGSKDKQPRKRREPKPPPTIKIESRPASPSRLKRTIGL
jgi:excisionase family DNA binding protein